MQWLLFYSLHYLALDVSLGESRLSEKSTLQHGEGGELHSIL
jgi:hypothetical protein